MKKVKIMLLSLALFAVVGGALAFKAKFGNSWCVAPLYGGTGAFTCTTLFQGDTFTTDCGNAQDIKNAGSVFSCTTVPDAILGCDTDCPVEKAVAPNN